MKSEKAYPGSSDDLVIKIQTKKGGNQMTRLGRGKTAILPAVVAVALLSIPAQAGRTMRVISKGLGAFGNITDMSNPADRVFGFISIQAMADPKSYMLFYEINDVAGTISDFGFGTIPASSVEVSGGSLDAGKEVVTLNVDTCKVADPGLVSPESGPCGVFDLTWTEEPASVGGSLDERQDSVLTTPGGGKMVSNSTTRNFFAFTTGTALGVSQTGQPTGFIGALIDGTSVDITISDPN